MKHSLRYSGMTLLEVMVALLIFALTGTAVMKAASDHLSSIGQLEEITFATWVANNRIARLQVSQTWPPRTGQRGREDMAARSWYWQQTVLATNDPELKQIEIRVGLDSSYQTSVASVVTYVTRPVALANSTQGQD